MRRQMRRELRPLTDEEGEVRELTRQDFRDMKPVREVMPDLIDAVKAFKKMGRPKAETTKVHIGFRLAADVVESLKASGPGYNQRVEQALRKAGFGAAKQKPAMTTAEEQILGRLGAGTLEPSAKEREAASKALAAALKRPAKKAAAKRYAPAKKHA
jgi:uncharacterized protein (DUF4415 family)